MSEIKKKADVLAIWKVFVQKVDDWGTDKQPVMVSWSGGVSRSLETLEPEITWLMSEFQAGQVFDRSSWETILAIDEFLRNVIDWAQRAKDDWQNTDPGGEKYIWDSFQAVARAAEENLPEKIETVAQLLSLPNMSAQQVARMYFWFDDLGNPDVTKVEEEKLNPGKHTSNWVNPAKVARDRKVEEAWVKRCEEFGGWDTDVFLPNRKHDSEFGDEPAQESIEELLSLPGMTFEQCARMKHLTIDQVRDAAKEIALANPMIAQMVSVDAINGRMAINHDLYNAKNMLAAAVIDSYPELDTVERIYAMADDGIRPGRILAALRATHCVVDYDQVVRILNSRPKHDASQEATDEEGTGEVAFAGVSDEAEGEQSRTKKNRKRTGERTGRAPGIRAAE
jgi:hypothetical protein